MPANGITHHTPAKANAEAISRDAPPISNSQIARPAGERDLLGNHCRRYAMSDNSTPAPQPVAAAWITERTIGADHPSSNAKKVTQRRF